MRFNTLSFVVPVTGAAIVYGASAAPALAYLDPGTGSMILQVLLGGAAGLALAGKLYWHRFLTAIGARPRDADAEPAEGEAGPGARSGASPRADG